MKKVLASVLAGSMILGMASMASAASLVKNSDAKDYNFEFWPYNAGGTFEQSLLPKRIFDEVETYAEKIDALKAAIKDDDDTKIKAAITALNNAYKAFYADFVALDADVKAEAEKKFTPPTTATIQNEVKTRLNAAYAEDASIGFSGNDVATLFNMKGKVAYTKALSAGGRLMGNLVLESYPTIANLNSILDLYTVQPGGNSPAINNKDSFKLEWAPGEAWNLYTYGDKNAEKYTIRLVVKKDEDLRVDVTNGDVIVTRKRVPLTQVNVAGADVYDIVVKADADVHDYELDDYKIEFDCHTSNLVFFVEGKVAYSDYREVEPDERYINTKSNVDAAHNDGCIYKFDQLLDEETRIICNDYVDLYLKGNYDTDFENLEVKTDSVDEVEEFFSEYGKDIDYYDFIATPKFAKDIKVIIDADEDSYIYEFDKKTHDVVDITDTCVWESNGWAFNRRTLKTYVILEEPYEGGNTLAEKEPVDAEPTEPDDTDATGSKPNPGTGAMPF